MKIGIEGQRLFRRKKHGMDMVALELIRNLQQLDTKNEYIVFVKPDADDRVFSETTNFKIVRLKGGFYPIWEQIALPIAARKAGCELLHCTSNTAPLWTNIPLMVTLHDIIYMETSYLDILRGKGTLYQKFGNLYRRLFIPGIVKKCCNLITVSEFERKRITEFFGIGDAQKLRAVYNGVSSHFKPITDPTECKRVKEKYKLPDRYFFFLGNTDPKKNTKGTLSAYSTFRKQSSEDIPLVMLDYELVELKNILLEIGDPELINHIVLTGYVANTDLPVLYSQCELFLYTSLRESFGIPMLEAMACGTPVITSTTSSMPEIAGDAALMIDPFNPDEITAAMLRLTTDQDLREALITKGFARAAQFSWKAMAEAVLKLYQENGAL